MSETLTVLTLHLLIAPLSLNQRDKMHWAARHRYMKSWKDELFYGAGNREAIAQIKQWATDKQKMRVEIEVFHSRMFDETNLEGSIKPIEDAIVSLGWAHDDRPEFMERSVTQFKSKRTEQRTIVRISRTEICVKGL